MRTSCHAEETSLRNRVSRPACAWPLARSTLVSRLGIPADRSKYQTEMFFCLRMSVHGHSRWLGGSAARPPTHRLATPACRAAHRLRAGIKTYLLCGKAADNNALNSSSWQQWPQSVLHKKLLHCACTLQTCRAQGLACSLSTLYLLGLRSHSTVEPSCQPKKLCEKTVTNHTSCDWALR